MRITDPLLPVIANDFSVTVGQLGIVVSAFAIPYALFQLAYGPLGDRVGKLTVIVYTLAGSSVFTIACALADSVTSLAALRLLSGIATAAVVPLSLAFIADNFAYEVRQPVIARYLSGLIMGQIAGGSLGGILAEFFGWRVIFVIFGVVVGALAYCLWRYARHHQETLRPAALWGRSLFRPYIKLLMQRRPRSLITVALLEGTFVFGAGAFLGAYLHHEYGLSYGVVGLMLACYGLGSLLYSYTARHVIAALGERGMIIVGSFTVAVCHFALAAASVWWWCIPILFVTGFGFYVMHNTLQTLATELAPEARGTAVSLFAFALIGGQGIGASIMGKVIDRFDFAIALVMVGVAILTLGAWFQYTLRHGVHTDVEA